jgi:hypothetical protein
MGKNMHEVIKLLFWALQSTPLIFFTIFTKYCAKSCSSTTGISTHLCACNGELFRTVERGEVKNTLTK